MSFFKRLSSCYSAKTKIDLKFVSLRYLLGLKELVKKINPQMLEA